MPPARGEGFDEPANEEIAAERVSAYSRAPLADLGASAYFATDFYEGAAHLVGALLDQPTLPYGEVFATEPTLHPRCAGPAAARPIVEGAETWLHRSPYFEGKLDYWYAFAGDPTASLAAGAGGAATADLRSPISPRWPPGRPGRHGLQLRRDRGVRGRSDGRPPAGCRDRPIGTADRGAGVRGPLCRASRRGRLPVLRGHRRPARHQPVARRLGARHRHAPRGRPDRRGGPPLADRADPALGGALG